MGYLSNSEEYLDFKSRYGSDLELISKAFDDDEVDLYKKIYDSVGANLPKPKKAYMLSKFNTEISECAYIRLNGMVSAYREQRYRDIGNIIINCSCEEDSYLTAINLIDEANNSGLPLPEPIVSWVQTTVKSNNASNKLNILANKYHVDLESLRNDKVGSVRFLINASNNETNPELIDKYFEIACKIREAYNFVTNNGSLETTVIANVASSLYKETYVVQKQDGSYRLATNNEIKKMPAGLLKHKKLLVPEESEKKINTAVWLITGERKFYKLDKSEDFIDKIKNNLDMIIASLNYIVSKEFIVDDKAKIIEGNKPTTYLDSAEDELTIDIKLVDMLKLIKKELDPEYGDGYSNLAWKIAADAIKNKKYILTEKQYKVIEDNYNKIINKKERAGEECKYKSTKPNENANVGAVLSEDLASKVESVKKFIKSKKGYKSNDFYKLALDICDKAIKYKKVSEKQENVLNKITAEIEKENNKPKAVQGDGVADINGTFVGSSNIKTNTSEVPSDIPEFLGNIEDMFN